MNTPPRWKSRFASFQQALQSLVVLAPAADALSELEQDGAIQRFEFCFELAWKTIQDYLSGNGYDGPKGPRPVLLQAAQDGLIDPYLWEEMLEARNTLSHVYDQAESRKLLALVFAAYLGQLLRLQQKLQSFL